MNDAGKSPKEVSFPVKLTDSQEIACQAGDRYKEKKTNKDGDCGNIVGAYPEHATPDNNGVGPKGHSRPESE